MSISHGLLTASACCLSEVVSCPQRGQLLQSQKRFAQGEGHDALLFLFIVFVYQIRDQDARAKALYCQLFPLLIPQQSVGMLLLRSSELKTRHDMFFALQSMQHSLQFVFAMLYDNVARYSTTRTSHVIPV